MKTAILAALAMLGSPASAARLRDGSHDFDFAAGKWTTQVTVFKDPFGDPTKFTSMTGTKVARPLWGGRGWIEEIEAGTGADHWQGATIFLYDPVAHQWSQTYADGDTGRMDAVAGVGQWHEGTLEFHWQQPVDGRMTMMRGVWKDFTPTAHTYEIDRSNDGGRSWHAAFIARVTRA
ncbi:hypothetical protein ABDK56_09260 [Sphingomonas sp. ASV193]|uniref:hypothetical protein n=1 Tax=Sphingomonas sp. ASV193 TaxID=3144405 RepID=UPI0032E8C527